MTADPATALPSIDELRLPTTVFDGYVIDLDGTVYLDDELLPQAAETVSRIRALGARVVFATNKPLEPVEAYAAKLTSLGVPATPDDVVTALDSLIRHLVRERPGASLLTIAEPVVDEACRRAGFPVVTDPLSAEVVLVSFDRSFSYAKLLAAYQAVRGGATIVATNPDPYCPSSDGGLPDCAAMLAALEACTGARAEVVAGKPSRLMGEALLERLGVPADRAAMVGDRLLTDVLMGQRLGLAGILTLSGATTLDDLRRAEVRPDFVISTLADLLPDNAQGPR